MRATIYQAALYCDPCGRRIAESLQSANSRRGEYAIADLDTGDSDDFPQIGQLVGESDSPDHCDAGEKCLDAINLCDWGLEGSLYGSETGSIGALVVEKLTSEGVAYLQEMLAAAADPDCGDEFEACGGCDECTTPEGEPIRAIYPPTPYQAALHSLWRACFSDYL